MPYAHLAAHSHAPMANSPGRLSEACTAATAKSAVEGGIPISVDKKRIKNPKQTNQPTNLWPTHAS